MTVITLIPAAFLLTIVLLATLTQVNAFRVFPTPRRINTSPSSALRAVIDCSQGAFDETVIKSEVPVIVDFYADWCGPCKLAGMVFKQIEEDYSNSNKNVKFVKVDTDINEDVVDRFTIQGLPLFGLFLGGEMVASHSGALNKEKLGDFIEKAFAAAKLKPSS